VNDAQLAELVGLEDGIGDRAANVGARGTQGGSPRGRRRINDGLYQWWLILTTSGERCQARQFGRRTATHGAYSHKLLLAAGQWARPCTLSE
jgi:hypothetical protein